SIWTVLDDEDLLANGQLDQRLSTLERHGDAGGVVEFGDVVNELRRAFAVSPAPCQNVGELADVEPLSVLLDLDELNPKAAKDRDRGEVGWCSHHDRIALVEQQPAHEVDGLLGAVRHQNVVM